MTSHTTKTTGCPSCGNKLDAATGLDRDAGPVPGDVTICIYCGHIMAFDNALGVRELTDEEIRAVAGDPKVIKLQRFRFKAMREHAPTALGVTFKYDGPENKK